MNNIHITSFAFAAGVRPEEHLAVSHPPYYAKPKRHRTRRALTLFLTLLSRASAMAAIKLDNCAKAITPLQKCDGAG